MSNKVYICLEKSGVVEETLISQSIFVKADSKHVEISNNGGSILVSIEDQTINCKFLDDVEDAKFNDHLVKKGAVYFFESQDKLVIGEVTISIKIREVVEKTVMITKPELNTQETQEEIQEELEEESQPTTKESSSFDFEIKEEKKAPQISSQIEGQNESQTRTSIDINELLKKAKPKKKGSKKGSKKGNQAQSEESLLSKSKKEFVSREKQSQKNKAQVKKSSAFKKLKKSSGQSEGNPVGPITRLFAVLSGITISISLYPYANHELIDKIVLEVFTPLTMALKSIDLPLIPEDIVRMGIIFILFELLSRILFSTSLPLFLIGVTNNGGFLRKRITAIIRFPLEMIAVVFPIGEFSLLLGKRSFKETLTLSILQYRVPTVKFIAPLLLIIITFLGYNHRILPNILPSQNSTQVVKLKTATKDNYKQFGHLLFSKDIHEKYHVIGASSPKTIYTLVDKNNGDSIQISQRKVINFSKFESIQKNIPLFRYNFPFINTFFVSKKSNEKVRQDVKKIITAGQSIAGRNPLLLNPKSLSIASVSYDFYKKLGISAKKILSSDDDYYHLYQAALRNEILFIDESRIVIFSIEMSKGNLKRVLPHIQMKKKSKVAGMTRLDTLLSLPSDQESVDKFISYQSELKKLMNENSQGIFNRHIHSLLDQLDETNSTEATSLGLKLKELNNKSE